MKTKKLISILLCIALVISMTACDIHIDISGELPDISFSGTIHMDPKDLDTAAALGEKAEKAAEAAETAEAEDKTNSKDSANVTASGVTAEELASMKPWINGTLKGAVTKDTKTDPKEDFYTFANKDYLLNAEVHPGLSYASSFNDVSYEFSNRISAMMDSFTSDDHDSIQAYTLYRLVRDMERRNKAGITPNQNYVEEIKSIKTIDDLTDYLLHKDFLHTLFQTSIDTDIKDSANYCVSIDASGLMLEDADEYTKLTDPGAIKKEAYQELLSNLLTLYGYSDAQIKESIDTAWELECQLASSELGVSAKSREDYFAKTYHPVTINELKQSCSNLPIGSLLEEYTSRGTTDFILMEPEWLKKLDSLYTEKNVEAFKAYLLHQELLSTADALDQTCLDLKDKAISKINGIEYHSDPATSAFDKVNELLPMAISKLYVDTYVSPDLKERITKLCHDALDAYKQILVKNDWLGEATRKKAIEKIEKIRVRAVYPDDWSYYSLEGLDLIAPEDGGIYLKELIKIDKFQKDDVMKKKLGKAVNREEWNMSPATINACYSPYDNSITITAGILNGIFYNDDMSDAQLMGTIGYVVGHEISHALDSNGSQYDADGNMNNWWTEEDRKNFDERVNKMVEYFNTIDVLPGKKINGQLTKTENTADLCGLQCMLIIAGQMDKFDYDAFFRSNAATWAAVMSYKSIDLRRVMDVHGPSFARVNATVQQFEEFHKTYDVKKGNAMYLAPEDRLKVW